MVGDEGLGFDRDLVEVEVPSEARIVGAAPPTFCPPGRPHQGVCARLRRAMGRPYTTGDRAEITCASTDRGSSDFFPTADWSDPIHSSASRSAWNWRRASTGVRPDL